MARVEHHRHAKNQKNNQINTQSGIYILRKIGNYAKSKIKNGETLPKLKNGIYSKFGQSYRYYISNHACRMYDINHIIQFLIPNWC